VCTRLGNAFLHNNTLYDANNQTYNTANSKVGLDTIPEWSDRVENGHVMLQLPSKAVSLTSSCWLSSDLFANKNVVGLSIQSDNNKYVAISLFSNSHHHWIKVSRIHLILRQFHLVILFLSIMCRLGRTRCLMAFVNVKSSSSPLRKAQSFIFFLPFVIY
jgi:hypothetical protein